MEHEEWIKQHLQVKRFWGESENAVRIQIHVAIITYCLIAIIEHDLKIGRPEKAGKYDFVVVGGGIAGICAAISAARLGCKVALVQNWLDGNYPVGGIPDIDENGLCDLAYMAEKGWVVQATTRQFDKNRDYLWPIPAADILVNPGLTQNPGY